MAKGNMFQGMARGKVGDVVFSRLNGEQISRVRNRYPKNPKTNAQLYQRAIMATVMAAYSNGKEIFDHSFQGYAKGAENQRKFLSDNAKLLRSTLAAEVNNPNMPTDEGSAHLTYPGGSVIIPNAYKISEGTYPQGFFTIDGGSVNFTKAAADTTTVSEYVAANGLIPGDIYTIVVIKLNGEVDPLFAVSGGDGRVSQVLPAVFSFVRLTVKADAATSSAVVSNLAGVFDIETSALFSSVDVIQQVSILPGAATGFTILSTGDNEFGAIGIIRSRLDVDLRSTSYMELVGSPYFGLNWYNVLLGWKQGTEAIGDSELILEGGNF